MRERSRMIPMNVKNGIARRVSLLITPKTRSGLACNSGQKRLICSGAKCASSTPITKNRRPPEASVNATG